ncbi:MAG: hypothetical protein J2O44_04805, partial [Porphyrobacter sp.]|nr:hypothetical protein [Porphyrobacter sp.]
MIVLPAGLALGTVGGHWARPVMMERAGDAAWQAMFQTRADRDGNSNPYPEQPQMTYVGGYSYPPDLAGRVDPGWTPPKLDAWTYANDVPLPTVAELDARQAALLADPDVEFAVHKPAADRSESADVAAQSPADEAQPAPEQSAAVEMASAA